MSLRINNNIAALNGLRNLQKNDAAVSRSLEKLSSGLRINRAADDAAGLVISEQMRAQITGLNQAIKNSETGVAMVQTAEGALDEINSLLNKARELALHAANDGANDINQLMADQQELDNVIEAVARIADFTQFGTKKIIDGTLNGVSERSSDLLRVNIGNLPNNPAIATGTMNLEVEPPVAEARTLIGGPALSGSPASGASIFSQAVSGMNLGSALIHPDTEVTITVDGQTIARVTVDSPISQADLTSALNAQAESRGYSVTYDNDANGFTITRNEAIPSNEPFTSEITFRRQISEGDGPGSTTASLTFASGAAGDASDAAQFFFAGTGLADLSDITENSALASGTSFRFILSTSDGNNIQGTIPENPSQPTIADIMSLIESEIRSNAGSVPLLAGGLSGATVSFVSANTGGFDVKVTLGDDSISETFSFSLTMDYNNSLAQQQTVQHSQTINSSTISNLATGAGSSTFIDAGGDPIATLTGGGPLYVESGVVINLTVNGTTYSVIADGTGTAMSGHAAALQALVGGDFTVSFSYTGGTVASPNSGVSANPGSFVMTNTAGKSFSFGLHFDQLQGTDAIVSTSLLQQGQIGENTYNLETTSQDQVAGSPAQFTTHSNGSSTRQEGVAGSVVMSDQDGATIHLRQSNVTSSGVTFYEQVDGGTAQGVNGVSLEITGDRAQNGGVESFTLSDGAQFQIGANQLQRTGITIQSVDADELGRNAPGGGVLTSLADMHSTRRSALTEGLTDEALAVIDRAVDEITVLRGTLGAFQSNTLETGLSNLRVAAENLTFAESVIRDVDFAHESAVFTRNQIMVQSSTAMLAQANQLPQNVLQLLG